MIDALEGAAVTITDLGEHLRSGGRFRVTNGKGVDVTMSVLATVVRERLLAGALATDRPAVADPDGTPLKRFLDLADRTAARTTGQRPAP